MTDRMEHSFDGGLISAPDFVQDVARLVSPAQLDRYLGVHQRQGRAQATAAIAADQLKLFGPQAAPMQIVEEGLPSLGALALGLTKVDDLLTSVRADSQRHQNRPAQCS